jgi:phenylalanyl-tRNA synthetase beta chain
MASDAMAALLERLGIAVEASGDVLTVTPPSFRFDLGIEVDYVEEVARVHGYDAIAPTLPVGRPGVLPTAEGARSITDLKRSFAQRDYFEVVTFSFVGRQLDRDFSGHDDAVALENPIASHLSVMRTSLLGSLVECARFNVARKQDRVRIFEVAGCYAREQNEFRQTERVAGLAYGSALPEQWGDGGRGVDYYDVRGDLEAIIGASRLTFLPGSHPAFHPGQAARVLCDGRPAGWVGALHPRLLQSYELPATAVAFELDAEVIRSRPLPRFEAISRFPPVRRDLAVIVDVAVSAAEVRSEILAVGAPLVADATLFDVYRGKGVPEGRKSLAFRVLLQDTEKTLTDQEVEALIRKIVKNLAQKQGATLRS